MLKQINYEKSDLDFDDPEIYKAYDIFMINRYMSCVETFVPFVEIANTLKLPKKSHYEFYKSIIPKNNTFINYIKKKKDEETDKILRCISMYFEVGSNESRIYMEMLNHNQIERIVSKFKYGKDGKKEV